MTATLDSRLAPYRVHHNRNAAINLNDLCAVANERAAYLRDLTAFAIADVEAAETPADAWSAVERLGRALDAFK